MPAILRLAGYNPNIVKKFVFYNIVIIGLLLAALITINIWAFHAIISGIYQGRGLLSGVPLFAMLLYVLYKQIYLLRNHTVLPALFVKDNRFCYLHNLFGTISVSSVARVDFDNKNIYFVMANKDVKAFPHDILLERPEDIASRANEVMPSIPQSL